LRIMVTGAAGMLGKSVVAAIRETGSHQLVGVTRDTLDLRDRLAVTSFVSIQKPDCIVHCAAVVGGIQANISRPFEFLHDNIVIDTNVLAVAADIGVPKLFYMGSSCMYPKNLGRPLSERDILTGPLEKTNENYALAKIVGTKLCQSISMEKGLNYKVIILSNLYGPGDNYNPRTSHLVASVLRKVFEAREKHLSSVEVWGTGRARREFTYVGDVASWIASSVEQINKLPDVLNLGYGQDHSVDDYYYAALEVLGHDARLIHNDYAPEGMMDKLLDSSIARNEFGWNPKTELKSGLLATASADANDIRFYV
jgi:GDP-L-fucose synthase